MNAPFKTPCQFTADEFERIVGTGAFRGLRAELRRGWITKMNARCVPRAWVKRKLARALAGVTVDTGELAA